MRSSTTMSTMSGRRWWVAPGESVAMAIGPRPLYGMFFVGQGGNRHFSPKPGELSHQRCGYHSSTQTYGPRHPRHTSNTTAQTYTERGRMHTRILPALHWPRARSPCSNTPRRRVPPRPPTPTPRPSNQRGALVSLVEVEVILVRAVRHALDRVHDAHPAWGGGGGGGWGRWAG